MPDCGECKGGVTRLTLRYLFGGSAWIEIYEGKKKNLDKLIAVGEVSDDQDTLTFNGIRSDGKMGSEISIWADEVFNTTIHTSCSQPIGPGMRFGPLLIVEGYSFKGGPLCPVEPSQGCGCEGKVTQLTLKYNGASTQPVVIFQKKDNDEVFLGFVEPSVPFTFSGHDKDGTLGTEISIYVGDDPIPTKIHTSCSQPISPGLIFGEFEVVERYSLKGGRLCPLGEDN